MHKQKCYFPSSDRISYLVGDSASMITLNIRIFEVPVDPTGSSNRIEISSLLLVTLDISV